MGFTAKTVIPILALALFALGLFFGSYGQYMLSIHPLNCFPPNARDPPPCSLAIWEPWRQSIAPYLLETTLGVWLGIIGAVLLTVSIFAPILKSAVRKNPAIIA